MGLHKTFTFRLDDDGLRMLQQLAHSRRRNSSDTLRMLVWEAFQEMELRGDGAECSLFNPSLNATEKQELMSDEY